MKELNKFLQQGDLMTRLAAQSEISTNQNKALKRVLNWFQLSQTNLNPGLYQLHFEPRTYTDSDGTALIDAELRPIGTNKGNTSVTPPCHLTLLSDVMPVGTTASDYIVSIPHNT